MMLTAARRRDMLLSLMGRVDPEVAAGAFRPNAKRKLLCVKRAERGEAVNRGAGRGV